MAIVSRTSPTAAGTTPPRAPTLHDQLVQRGARWLRSQGCKIVLTEFRALTREFADVLAWRGTDGPSVLIECKTSRSDFLADRAKPFRVDPARGLGEFRYFLCPPGLIRPDDLPEQWGLLYAHEKTITVEVGVPARQYYTAEARTFAFKAFNERAERVALLSALCRLQLRTGVKTFDAAVNQAYDPGRNERSRQDRALKARQQEAKTAVLAEWSARSR